MLSNLSPKNITQELKQTKNLSKLISHLTKNTDVQHQTSNFSPKFISNSTKNNYHQKQRGNISSKSTSILSSNKGKSPQNQLKRKTSFLKTNQTASSIDASSLLSQCPGLKSFQEISDFQHEKEIAILQKNQTTPILSLSHLCKKANHLNLQNSSTTTVHKPRLKQLHRHNFVPVVLHLTKPSILPTPSDLLLKAQPQNYPIHHHRRLTKRFDHTSKSGQHKQLCSSPWCRRFSSPSHSMRGLLPSPPLHQLLRFPSQRNLQLHLQLRATACHHSCRNCHQWRHIGMATKPGGGKSLTPKKTRLAVSKNTRSDTRSNTRLYTRWNTCLVTSKKTRTPLIEACSINSISWVKKSHYLNMDHMGFAGSKLGNKLGLDHVGSYSPKSNAYHTTNNYALTKQAREFKTCKDGEYKLQLPNIASTVRADIVTNTNPCDEVSRIMSSVSMYSEAFCNNLRCSSSQISYAPKSYDIGLNCKKDGSKAGSKRIRIDWEENPKITIEMNMKKKIRRRDNFEAVESSRKAGDKDELATEERLNHMGVQTENTLWQGFLMTKPTIMHDCYIISDYFYSQIWSKAIHRYSRKETWRNLLDEELQNICNIWWIPTEESNFIQMCNSSFSF